MKHPVAQLYEHYRTEKSFGWYIKPPWDRAEIRELYPIDWIAANHRGDATNEQMDDHIRRVLAYNKMVLARAKAKRAAREKAA